MKIFLMVAKSFLLIAMVLCSTVHVFAAEETEITGFYQQYRNFDYRIGGGDGYEFPSSQLKGGGFSIAQNLAPWFAMWTQFSFYGSVQDPNLKIRILNNLQGIRYQTKEYGPLRLYAKGGLGFSRYSMDIGGNGAGDTKFSLAYGAGAHVWMHKNFGVVFDATHVVMGLPNLTDSSDREKWDSGLTYTTGLTIRF